MVGSLLKLLYLAQSQVQKRNANGLMGSLPTQERLKADDLGTELHLPYGRGQILIQEVEGLQARYGWMHLEQLKRFRGSPQYGTKIL